MCYGAYNNYVTHIEYTKYFKFSKGTSVNLHGPAHEPAVEGRVGDVLVCAESTSATSTGWLTLSKGGFTGWLVVACSHRQEDTGTEMAQDIPETTYVPEVEQDARKERERRAVEEGTVSWRRRKEELQCQKHREQRELQQILESYSPWGKPGGGAPCAATLRKKNVPLEPPELSKCHNFGQGWTSNSTIERLHRRSINPLPVTDMNKFFDDKAEPGIATDTRLVRDSKNPYNEEIQVYELTGGVELVPLLTSRRYYSQSQNTRHVATDATRPGYTIDSYEERKMELESCRRHFDTWRKLWGRPGHGAPIDHAHRNNLYNILYRPAIY
ncbi:hypothetical protein E2986_11156 [Frieseomelitta varia]|uniref:Uncharacterized protein n=1 Tax=Frieseomelitta varia TaxID=561572 RepID=A0A833SD45_9HYME|nr:hypothetical protein E2986_11156 [Frieseomelitta varia]